MACRRSISSRLTLLRQRYHPSFAYIIHDDDGKRQPPPVTDASTRPAISNILQKQTGVNNINKASAWFETRFQVKGLSSFSLPPGFGPSFCRHMSSTIGEGSDKIEYISDVAEILTEKSVDVAQVPAVSEVAIAAADSFYPVAALQYLIDGIHSFTGLNWWASIALTTILIRGATIPLLINQLKATSKLTLMRPRLEEIRQQMQDMEMDPKAVAEGQKRMKAIFREYGVTPFTPLKGLFIQGPVFISFYLAISNMVEKVPSFKGGGAFWFTDLTTPDNLYIFPVLTSLTFLITVECNMQEGLEGNPAAGTMKNFSRILAVFTIPFTMNFPKAIFCYWVTSNLFSLTYGLVLKSPSVKEFLGLPKMPVPPPTTTQSSFSMSSLFKPSTPTTSEASLPVEPSKVIDRRISSSSVLSQRLRSLEKQVKGRKKNKKR
ncbi:PREDICTED: mitochondrial inner membrane protein OXA1-like [Nelumbo nucifera]|uniref:Mitochondrial inner membrane protein OXA1-like n=1 Tax=Nelumbo nucifera TaxID=4432 RepID=A0A1U8A8X5_NELNU|nr:PREDICTED: mitochondrial inner membrane protein OXA1-like [Nelumbo nucifera]